MKNKEDIKSWTKLGFLGPKGTFSHQAALRIFPEYNLIPFETIKDVFDGVIDQKIDLGVVPAENTIGGIVSETINKLIKHPLEVTGSFDIPIHHCLLGMVKDMKELKVIKSHKQALSQCSDWLEGNLPKVKLESAPSTTSPIADGDGETGFIASEVAAEEYSLNILARNIESTKDNISKFYVIANEINEKIQRKLKSERTLILFAVQDRIGILRDILDVFAKKEINLSSLHSIPSRLRPWDYFFFTEAQIPLSSSKLKGILKELEKYCQMIRVIGAS